MTNFKFLKNIDTNAYEIIAEAEKLYRDEYFEQSITQTRRFGEIICKNVLGDSLTSEKTFDDMLATLKDKVSVITQEKEFVDDLYFLKKEGNASVHSSKIKKDGMIALECLKRAFEISISYAVYFKKANSNILKLEYDTELLVTGQKSKNSLTEKYLEAKNKTKSIKTKKKKVSKRQNKVPDKKFSLFPLFLTLSAIISFSLIIVLLILNTI